MITINNGDWKIVTNVDEDGHLSIYVSHNDGTEVIEVNEDIGHDNEFGVRLTTQKIEEGFCGH